MTDKETIRSSKFLSLVLRHQPETAFVTLDSAGWVRVEELLRGCAKANHPLTPHQLEHIVATNAKRRFEFSADGQTIRASQGHSVEVELEYETREPPPLLYHGTPAQALESIRAGGLRKMQRHHVHLTEEQETALSVGSRRGKAVCLTVDAAAMHRAGHHFSVSSNGVWLTDNVPPRFIRFPLI